MNKGQGGREERGGLRIVEGGRGRGQLKNRRRGLGEGIRRGDLVGLRKKGTLLAQSAL